MEKFGTFWEGIDLKRPFAVYFKALKYIVKLLYVLDLFLLFDAPLLQIYLAVIIQVCYIILHVYSWPFESKRGNWEELIFLSLTVLLMINCVVYEEKFKTPSRARMAEKTFIFGFLFMMLIVIGLIIFDFIKKRIEAYKKKKE